MGVGACLGVGLLAVTGCSSGSTGEADAGSTPQNRPPVWAGATTPVTVREGSRATVPVMTTDPDGDAVEVVLESSGLLEGLLSQGVLTLRAPYGVTGTQQVTLTLRDAPGATTSHVLAVDVDALTWGPRVTWSQPAGPEEREHPTVFTHDATGSIYVIDGSGYSPYGEVFADGWRFDTRTSTWSPCTLMGDVPTAAGSRRLAGVRGSGEGWMFGGYAEGQVNNAELIHVVGNGDTLTFTNVPQTNPPPSRALHAFGYDPGSQKFVLFGGGGDALYGDTWFMTLSNGTAVWENATAAQGISPAGRFGPFFGMDEERGIFWLFSGQTSGNRFANDTWYLDMRANPPTWDQAIEATDPPAGRRNGSYVFDPTGPRLWVFGGTFDGRTTAVGLFALDATVGAARWDSVLTDGQPPRRSSGIGTFVDGAVWIGFGNDDGVYKDLTRLGH